MVISICNQYKNIITKIFHTAIHINSLQPGMYFPLRAGSVLEWTTLPCVHISSQVRVSNIMLIM